MFDLSKKVWETHLSATSKIVLLALADYANEEKECWPSQKKLAEKCGLSYRTVVYQLKYLAKNNYITSEKQKREDGSDTSCLYKILLIDPQILHSCLEMVQHGVLPPSALNADQESIIITNKRENNKRENILSLYSKDFETFWKAYPKKVSKGMAWQQWQKLKPPLSLVLQALDWQKETKQWKGGYILAPERYIKRRSWEDEPEEKICALPDLGYYR